MAITALATAANAADLTCDIGPVTRTYGKTSWLVYSCNDGHSVVAVAAPGNPAAPSYFMIHPSDHGYRIEGEGTGAKAASDAALDDLKTLTVDQIDSLIAQTKTPRNSN